MFRKSALIVLPLITALIIAVLWLSRSSLTETLAENLLQDMFHSKVDIQGMKLDLTEMQLQFDGLTIGDPDRELVNLLQTGKGRLDLEGMPLFARQLVIKQAEIEGIQTGTARRNSGWLTTAMPLVPTVPTTATENNAEPAEVVLTQDATSISTDPADSSHAPVQEVTTSNSTQTLEAGKAALPSLNLGVLDNISTDNVVDKSQLSSIKAIEKSRQKSLDSYELWSTRLNNETLSTDSKVLQQRIEQLPLNNINDVATLNSTLTELKEIKQQASQLKERADTLQSDAKREIVDSRLQINNLQYLINQDIKQAKKLANISDLNLSEVGKMIFGHATVSQFDEVLSYLQQARGFLSAPDQTPQPLRRQGREINFPLTGEALPGLLLRKVSFSGEDESKHFNGELLHLNSNPKYYHQAVTLSLHQRHDSEAWQVRGEFDYRNDNQKSSLYLHGQQVELGSIDLGGGSDSGLPKTMTPGKADVRAEFVLQGTQLHASLDLFAQQVVFEMTDSVKEQVREVFDDIHRVNVDASISGELANPKIKVTSNLDDKLKKRFEKILSDKVKVAEKAIRTQVKQQVDEEKNKVNKELKEKLKPLKKQLRVFDIDTNELMETVTKHQRDIERKLNNITSKAEQELKNKVKKQAEDKLKNLIKGF